MNKISLFILSAYLLLLFPLHASAGNFKAVPIRLYLDSKTKTAVLKVTNEGEEKVTVQLEAVEWQQDENGKDIYQPSKEIIFFPKIADIEKGEEKIIRVGYEGKKADAAEKTYRLYVQELPVSKPGEAAVKMAVRLGIPVFIKPVKEAQGRSLEGMSLSDGAVMIKVKNSGNSHLIISRLRARGLDSEGKEAFAKEAAGWYVLSGRTRTFAVDLPKEDCLKANEIKVETEIDKGMLEGKFTVDKNQCADKPKPPAGREIKPAAAAD